MPENTSSAINPIPAASESLASSAAVIPDLMPGKQTDVLAQALGFLSAQDATAISRSSPTLNNVVKSASFNALWLQHIQRDYPGLVIQQPPQQAYRAARLFQEQHQALRFLLLSSHKIKDYNYSTIEQAVGHFKTSTLKQRTDYLSQWNNDLGLHQLKNANHKDVQLQGLTELTPAVMQRLTVINQKTSIIRLAISRCYLPKLPEALINFLKACTQLQELCLKHNQLQSLPETLLQTCTQLQELCLSHNQLQSLPETLLQACTQLKQLDLDNNQLQSLPETLLQTCIQLQALNLNHNQLQSLPEILLQTCAQLQWLSLSHNQLQSLPKTLLQTCAQLQALGLSHNQLQSLPETLLQTCIQLEVLDLNNNQLQSLPENLLKTCTQLESLSLSHNHLITVTRNDFRHLSKISSLDIESQTSAGASNSSAIIPEQKTIENENEPPQKKMRPNR